MAAPQRSRGEMKGPLPICTEPPAPAPRVPTAPREPPCRLGGGCSPPLELPLQLGAGEGNQIPGLTALQSPALGGAEETR